MLRTNQSSTRSHGEHAASLAAGPLHFGTSRKGLSRLGQDCDAPLHYSHRESELHSKRPWQGNSPPVCEASPRSSAESRRLAALLCTLGESRPAPWLCH